VTLNEYAKQCHADMHQYWHNPDGTRRDRNRGELFDLMHTEISEASTAVRKDLMDDHLPHRKGVEVELVDVLIRIFDFAGAYGFDLDAAYREKRAYNQQREDHKIEALRGSRM
jgi:hypothetical protein